MATKRFILYEYKDNDYILDNPNVHLDFIEMLGDALTSEEIVDLLNELHEENQIKLEIVDAFILGMEDEKGIAPEDKEFQCKMNHTIKELKRLKEEMLNPTEFKRLKEYLEQLEGNVK